MPRRIETLLPELERFPDDVERAARDLGARTGTIPPGGGFSLLEHAWHLADLEREGWGRRIERLRQGGRPRLPDIDGERLALERSYRTRSLGEGLALFRKARRRNLELLRSLSPAEWDHEGVQEKLGPLRLRDVPRLMWEHDKSHREEIRALLSPRGRAAADAAPRRPPLRWHLLIHQLPPKPLYLRAKVRNRLAKVGAVALKNSVYVLPQRDDCLEDLQWIAQEALAGGGEAWVCRAELLSGVTDEALVERFRAQSASAYETLKTEATRALEAARGGGRQSEDPSTALLRLKTQFDEVAATDFFASPSRKEVETMLRALERQGRGAQEPKPGRRRAGPELVGRTWVTRKGAKIDRLACAWLIRRFVDPGARFRFIDPERESPRPGEIGFDMVGGEFTHEGDRCSFETLVARLAIEDPGVRQVAEIVHDVDVKDGKYGRPDAAGVQQLVLGLVQAHRDDEERLARGIALFDDLYASFGAASGRGGKPAGGRRKRAAKNPRAGAGRTRP
jgi:hypothetical protein